MAKSIPQHLYEYGWLWNNLWTVREKIAIMNILITGTSSGIGYGLAREYLERGETVFGISRHTHDTLMRYENYRHLTQDITEFRYCSVHVANFLKGTQHLDIVILNSGILNQIKEMRNTTVEEFQESMNVNVWGNKVVLDTAMDMCSIDQVVGMSSGAAVGPTAGWNAYSVSKAAFKMLIEMYAEEHPDIHFSSIAPGLVDTAMQEYISTLEPDEKFPVIERLQEAKGTDAMPRPEEASEMLIDTFENVKNESSGVFTDVRKR